MHYNARIAATGLVLLLASASYPQKKFIPPKEDGLLRGYVMGSLLFKDKDCWPDYIKSEGMSGLERRKSIAELIKYGCAEPLNAAYSVTALETETVTIGEKKITFRRALLRRDDSLTLVIYGKNAVTAGIPEGTGWIPESAFVKQQDIDAAVAAAVKAEREKPK